MNLSKILSGQRLLVVIFLACILSLPIIFYFLHNNQKENSLPNTNTSPAIAQEKTDSPLPLRLKIPDINVDAAVEYVGLTPEGRVGVPSGPSTVAWFNLGPRPGEIGDSIIDGHSGYKDNRPAVFDTLYKLKKDDKIYIEDSAGTTITFVVTGFRSFSPKVPAPDVFISKDGKAHLNLVTCTGDWDEEARTHSDRLVVFTDRE